MKKTSKIKGLVLKSFIIIAVVIMLLNVMPGEGAVGDRHGSNGACKSRFEKTYKLTKITLPCNMCKLVLKWDKNKKP
ncbi:MAG: hypothetical protein QMC80_03795 [Thermoplasmatales archaeon]|nr:hypothetical protein [Thermoplasmatales archaeon]